MTVRTYTLIMLGATVALAYAYAFVYVVFRPDTSLAIIIAIVTLLAGVVGSIRGLRVVAPERLAMPLAVAAVGVPALWIAVGIAKRWRSPHSLQWARRARCSRIG